MPTIHLMQDDVRTFLPKAAELHPAQFNLIFTDFPYWTLNKWAGVGTTARMGLGRKDSGSDKRDAKFYDVITEQELYLCMDAMDRLLKLNSHLYMMCDDEVSDCIKQYFYRKVMTFNYCKRIVWDKIDRGMGYHYRGTYEHIVVLEYDAMLDELEKLEQVEENPSEIEYLVFLEKGKRKLNDLALPDVVHHKRVQGKTVPQGLVLDEDMKHYPTEKPYALVEQFVLNSTQENDWVLDPTMGSGVVAEVCLRHNRNFVGVDKSPRSIQWTHCRLQNVLAELDNKNAEITLE